METTEKFYDKYWEAKTPETDLKLAWRYQKAFEFTPEGSKVLDIGCGCGQLGKILIERKGCQVLGADISASALEAARKKGLETIKLDAEREWPFQKNEFDVVIGLELLEHLFQPEKVLANIAETAKTAAVFSYANTVYIKNRLNILLGKVPGETPFRNGQHLHYWSHKGFLKFIESYFKIVECNNLGHIPPFSRLISFPSREWIGRHVFPNIFSNGTVVKAKPK